MTKIQNNKKIPKSYNLYLTKAKAFTLLELLLVIAVIAVLAGVVLFNLNPAQRLDDAKSAQTMAKSDDIRKAIEAYAVDHSGSMPTNIASLTTYGLHDVCKFGQSTNCLNLDQLVTDGYLGSIPEDTDGSTTVISGYKLEYNPAKNNVQVYNTDSFTEYVEDGATLTNGLVGYWRMDENTGTTTADSSGNNNTGTLTNGPTWTAGRYANGINFDGVNDYANLSTPGSALFKFASTQDFTVSAWVKTTQSTAGVYPTIVGNESANNRTGFTLGIDAATGKAFFTSRNSCCPSAYGNTTINTGQWFHLIGIRQGDTLKLYVNNILDASQSSGAQVSFANSQNLYFGMDPSSFWKFSGQIDEVRIYNRSLNIDEITALYNYLPSAVAHWKFDETSGTSATDSSGNENTGTLTNGPLWTGGKYGNALNFDGVDDYISIADSVNNTLDVSRNVTITAWIKPNNFSSYRHIISKGALNCVSACPYDLRLIPSTGNIDLHRAKTSYFSYKSLNTLNIGQWNHIAALDNGIEIKFYINGTDAGSVSSNGSYSGGIVSDNSVEVRIGRRIDNGEIFFGAMDDIRLYNYALTQTQIQKVMNNEI